MSESITRHGVPWENHVGYVEIARGLDLGNYSDDVTHDFRMEVDDQEEMEGQFNLQALVKKVEEISTAAALCYCHDLPRRHALQEQEERREKAEEAGPTPQFGNEFQHPTVISMAGPKRSR